MLQKTLTSCFALVLGAVLASDLMAQGRIVGTVFDDTQSVVPGVSVTATHEQTNIAYNFETNESGKYDLPSLPTGPYMVRAELTGFKASEARVIVEIAQVTQQDFTLELGALQDTVTVSAEAQAPLLQAESPEIGQVITNRLILELPLNGRNFEQLATLGTGVYGAPGGLVVVNGARPTQAIHQIDNMSTNTILNGRNQARPSIETLQEFKLQSSTFAAEHGRAPGIINVSTRSGNNRFHGNVYEFFRNDVVSANNFFENQRANPRKTPLNRNQFGTTFSGPIVRNRTFFFANYEGQRMYRGSTINGTVPTPMQKAGDFSQTPGVAVLLDLMSPLPPGFPIPYAPLPGNKIPATRIHPTYEYFKDWWPESNSSASRFISSPRATVDNNQFSNRSDHHFSSSDRIWARYFFSEGFTRNRGWGTRPDLIGGNTVDNALHQVAAHWNHTFSPSLLLDVSWGYMSARSSNVGTGVCFQEDGCTNHTVESGIGGMDFGSKFYPGTPTLFFAGAFLNDFNWASPLRTTAQNHSLKANTTWVKGKHTIRGGVDFLTQGLPGATPLGARGVFSFLGASTLFANNWPDFVMGTPTIAQRAAPRTGAGSERDTFQFFVQDDFKITPRLTLNLGVRYDFNFAPVPMGAGGAVDTKTGKVIFSDVNGDGVPSPAFSPSLPILLPLIGEENLVSSTELGLHPSFVNTDHNNFAPRIGLAWRPFQKTVIRTGYGLYYLVDIVGNIATFFSQAPPFSLVEVQNNLNNVGRGPFWTFENMYTNLDELRAIPPNWTAVGINPDTHTPYENQYSFSIQHQLNRSLVFEIGYVGKTSVHLQSNRPIALPETRPAFVPPGLTLVTQEANNNYNSLQTRLEKRYSGGLAFLASYTWSKTIDIASGNLGDPGAANAQRGLADYDIPHRFVFSSTFDLPFGRERRWLNSATSLVNAVLGGWQVSAIGQYQSGRVFNVTWAGGNTGAGPISIAARPDRVKDGSKDNPTPEEWFDTSAFAPHMKPPNPDNPGFFLPEEGDAGRNFLRSDGLNNWDIGINKNFYWGENDHYRVQFRAEMFNAFNTPRFGQPVTQLGTPNAGRVFSAGPARQVQFALKFYY